MVHLFPRRKRWGEANSCHEMVFLVHDVAEYVLLKNLLLLKYVCVSSDNWIRLGFCEFCELVLGFSRLLVSGRFVYTQPPIRWLIDNFRLLSLALFLRVKEGQGALVTITTTTIATLTCRTTKQCVVGSSCENGCSLVSLALFSG